MVNALIGGTVLSDSLGKGAKLTDTWPLHLTTTALVVGMGVAIASVAKEGSTVHLITIAQACTVLGIPALAAALIFLATRRELTHDRKVPRWTIVLAIIGFLLSCVLAMFTANKVYQKVRQTPDTTSMPAVNRMPMHSTTLPRNWTIDRRARPSCPVAQKSATS